MKLLNLGDDYLLKRYKSRDKTVILELQLQSGPQLFDQRDPSPLKGRDLNESVVRYIRESFEEIPASKEVILKIYFDEGTGATLTEGQMASAIQGFFMHEAHAQEILLKKTLTHGFKSLLIGLSFLFVCVFSYYSSKNLSDSLINNYLKEVLHVLGWVSMWHPINIFLYEWWPIVAKKNLFIRIAQSKIQVSRSQQSTVSLDNVI